MNHLKTNINGGFPAHLNDVRWLQNNLISVIKTINSGLSNINETQYVFYAAPMFLGTGSAVNVTEGWVFIHDELCYIPFHTWDETQEASWFITEDVYEGEGFKQFQNGSTHDTYLKRVAKLQSGPLSSRPAGAPLFIRANQMHLWMAMRRNMILVDVIDWRDLPGAAYVYPVNEGRAQIYRDDCGFVHFRGQWNHDDPSDSMIIGTLPIGFRPEKDIRFAYVNATISIPSLVFAFEIIISASTGVIDIVGTGFPQSINCISFPSFKAV